MNVRGDGETPFAMPLCGLPCPSDMPPWVARRWSGSIEFNRDCAVCPAYSPLTEATTANSVGMSEANAPTTPPVKTGEG